MVYKSADPSFRELTNYDIFCLTETWTCKTSDIDIDSHFALYQPKRKAGAKRKSGGIIVYIKDELSTGISLLKNSPHDIIWLRLDKAVFNIDHYIILGICYIIPENSSYQSELIGDTSGRLMSDVSQYSTVYDNCKFITCGDMNSRTDDLTNFIRDDNSKHIPLPTDYSPDDDNMPVRTNSDHVVNNQGRKLIELCKMMCNMRIVNGRIGKDANVGARTCVTYNGSSTVDHVLCSSNMLAMFDGFNVLPQNTFSDHNPLLFQLSVSPGIAASVPSEKTERLLWDDPEKENFIANIRSEVCINKLNKMVRITQTPEVTADKVNSAVDTFVQAMRSAADPCSWYQLQTSPPEEKNMHPRGLVVHGRKLGGHSLKPETSTPEAPQRRIGRQWSTPAVSIRGNHIRASDCLIKILLQNCSVRNAMMLNYIGNY